MISETLAKGSQGMRRHQTTISKPLISTNLTSEKPGGIVEGRGKGLQGRNTDMGSRHNIAKAWKQKACHVGQRAFAVVVAGGFRGHGTSGNASNPPRPKEKVRGAHTLVLSSHGILRTEPRARSFALLQAGT